MPANGHTPVYRGRMAAGGGVDLAAVAARQAAEAARRAAADRAAPRAVSWPVLWRADADEPPPGAVRGLALGTAIGTLVLFTGYLVWRVSATLAGTNAVLAALLLALEFVALGALGVRVFELWDL